MTQELPFHLKRRQHFLSEERWQYIQKDVPDSLNHFEERRKSTDLGEQAIYYLNVGTHWEYLRACYTAGEPIETLAPMLDDVIDTLRECTTFWFENRSAVIEMGYIDPFYFWQIPIDYLRLIQMIAMCYLLQREDLLPKLLAIILETSVDQQPDAVIEDLFYYHFKDRPDPEYIEMGEHAALLSDSIREKDPQEKKALLNQYLKDWYKQILQFSYIEYNSHMEEKQMGFYGYWSFEAAVIAYLDDVDDTEFYQYPYYPKDLVEWAREQRRIRYAKQDSASPHPLLLSVGKNAPFSGKYGVDNFSGFEKHFQAGDVLPDGQVSGKRDEEGNPIFRKDAIWRLLSRDDGGSTRFTPDELAKY